MVMLGRRPCGCTCRNMTGWNPGSGLPSHICSACGGTIPCEFVMIMGKCTGPCDSIFSGEGVDRWISLKREGCLAEAACRYTHRTWADLSGQETGSGSDIPGLCQALGSGFPPQGPGLDGFCGPGNYPSRFPNVVDGVYKDLVLGCPDQSAGGIGARGTGSHGQQTDLDDVTSNRCGWFDLFKMIRCAAGLDTISDAQRVFEDYDYWLTALKQCSRIDWELNFTEDTASIIGTTASGHTINYNAVDWTCGGRSTFVMADYPDSECPKLPKNICVVPGYATFFTYCTNPADVQNCCDPGIEEMRFRLASDVCPVLDGMIVCAARYQNSYAGSFGLLDAYRPTGACGFFYGLTTYSVGSQGRYIALFAWCDGGEWSVTMLCGAFGSEPTTVHHICTVSDVLQICCPYPILNWNCDADFSGTGSDGTLTVCCGEPEPVDVNCSCTVPSVLYATLANASCATIDGQVVTLTYAGVSGSNHNWTGTFSAGSCGTLTVTYTIPETLCRASASITSSGGTCTSGATGTDIPCPFTSDAVLCPSWLNPPCTCCTNGSATTITVSV